MRRLICVGALLVTLTVGCGGSPSNPNESGTVDIAKLESDIKASTNSNLADQGRGDLHVTAVRCIRPAGSPSHFTCLATIDNGISTFDRTVSVDCDAEATCIWRPEGG